MRILEETFFFFSKFFSHLSSRLPSIWKTPIGFITFYLVIIFGDILSLLYVLPTTSFILGSGWLFKSFMEDIRNQLPYLNVYDESNGDEDDKPIGIHFCNIVKLYTNVKELRFVHPNNDD